MKISEFIKEHRLRAGYTQKKLSSIMGYSSPQLISNIERGLCEPPIKSLKKLSKLLMLSQKEKNSLYQMLIKKHEDNFKRALLL